MAALKVPIHQSLVRTQLFWGCEKLGFKYLMVLTAVLIFFTKSLFKFYVWNYTLSLAFISVFFVFGVLLLRAFAHHDPQFFAVLLRKKNYRKVYPARGGV